jgi:hypothetical protein
LVKDKFTKGVSIMIVVSSANDEVVSPFLNQTVVSCVDEIKPVLPKTQWDDLTYEELCEQRSILYDKWDFLQGKGLSYAADLMKAHIEIDEIIQNKLIR